jgi:hypothetical protein
MGKTNYTNLKNPPGKELYTDAMLSNSHEVLSIRTH